MNRLGHFVNLHENQGKLSDVGYSSVCCKYFLLTLVNKETTLAYAWQNITRWKSQTEYQEKEGGVEGDTSSFQRSKM